MGRSFRGSPAGKIGRENLGGCKVNGINSQSWCAVSTLVAAPGDSSFSGGRIGILPSKGSITVEVLSGEDGPSRKFRRFASFADQCWRWSPGDKHSNLVAGDECFLRLVGESYLLLLIGDEYGLLLLGDEYGRLLIGDE